MARLSSARRIALAAVGVAVCTAGLLVGIRFLRGYSRSLVRRDTWVLVSRFDNRTGEAQLDGVLDFALKSALSNSGVIHVAAPERLRDTLRLMRRPADSPIDAQTGREVCIRDGGIQAVVTGRAEKVAGSYVLDVSLIDAQSGTTLRSFHGEARNELETLSVLDRLGNKLRKSMGETDGEISRSNQRLDRVTTSSLRALQLFSVGSDRLVAGSPSDDEAAASLFTQAIQLDPEFASAYLYLGWAQINNLDQPGAVSSFRRAMQLSDKASERERLFIQLSWYELQMNDGDLDRAIHWGDMLTTLYPDFYWGVANQADSLLAANRPDESAAMSERALRLRPNDFGLAENAWEAFTNAGRSDLAQPFLAEAKRIAARSTNDPGVAFWMPLIEASEKWNSGSAVGAATALAAARPAYPADWHDLAIAYLSLGQLRKAEEVAHRAAFANQVDMLAAFLRGGVAGLRSYAREHPASKDLLPGGIINLLYARVGALGYTSEAIHRRLLHSAGRPQIWLAALAGEEEMNGARYLSAISDLRVGLKSPNSDVQRMFLSNSLATALEERGDRRQAIGVLESVSSGHGEILWGAQMRPLVLEHLARLYRAERDDARAKVLEEKVRIQLAAADDDYSLAAQLAALPAPQRTLKKASVLPKTRM